MQDEDLINEANTNLEKLEHELNKFDVQLMLSGEYDTADAMLAVNAGAGGTDCRPECGCAL